MKKRKLAMSMAIVMAVSAGITGCSSQNQKESIGAEAEVTEAAEGEKELTMWYQENATMIPAFNQRVEDFNKEYEGKYHLTIEYIPRGSSYAYEDKVNSAAAAGILPDLLSLDGPNLSNYAANGIIIPITSPELFTAIDSQKKSALTCFYHDISEEKLKPLSTKGRKNPLGYQLACFWDCQSSPVTGFIYSS